MRRISRCSSSVRMMWSTPGNNPFKGSSAPLGMLNFLDVGDEDMEVLTDPDPHRASKLINARRNTHALLVYGELTASYEGRARSELSELMPRLILSKPDGSFAIHEATKREPSLWNPPPSNLYVTVDRGVLVLRSVRSSPREVVVAEIPVLRLVVAVRLGVTGDYRVFGTERDMVERILRDPNIVEPGLRIIEKEYETMVGHIDLLAQDSQGNIVVIELKRNQAGPDSVHQLRRYVDHLTRKGYSKVRGILVAPSISSLAYRYLRTYGLEYRRMSPLST